MKIVLLTRYPVMTAILFAAAFILLIFSCRDLITDARDETGIVYCMYIAGTDDSIGIYKISNDGTPEFYNSFGTLNNPLAIAYNPASDMIHAATVAGSDIINYGINDNYYTLEFFSTIATRSAMYSLVFNAEGTRAYSTHLPGSRYLRTYSVGSDGSLVDISEIELVSPVWPLRPVLHPSLPYLYIPNETNAYSETSGSILQYSIDSSGIPAADGAVSQYYGPVRAVIHPSGLYLYSTSYMSSTSLFAYTINTDGTLTPNVNGASYTSPGGVTGAFDLVLNRQGNYLYVQFPYYNRDRIGVYSINADGSLTYKNYVECDAGTNFVNMLIVHPGKDFLYAQQENNTIVVFTIDSDGSLVNRKTVLAPVIGQACIRQGKDYTE